MAWRHIELEELLGVVLEDQFLVRRAQPVERLDQEARFIQPPARARILHRADPRTLRAEQASIRADGLDQQLERFARIEHRVVVQIAHLVGETLAAAAQRAGFEARPVVGNRAAAVRNQNLQRRKIFEHVRFEQRHDADAFLIDEVQRVRETRRPAARRMDVAGNIQLHHLFVQRIPEAVAQRRSCGGRGFARIRIQQASDESHLFDALFQIRQNFLGADAGTLRQAANPAEHVGVELGLLVDDVVGLFDEPAHDLGVLAVHHLVGTRRDELHVGPDFLELLQMRGAAEHRRVQRVLDLLIGGAVAAAAVRAAMGQDVGLVDVQLFGGSNVAV